ncbi:MAG: Sec-independent protein translocase protein TatB [Pseudomonadota bacterium]
MFDIGWSELMVIGVVALIVLGPQDFTQMFRKMGQFTARARNMAGEFKRAMNDAAEQTGVKDTASSLKSMASTRNMGLDSLGEATGSIGKWDPSKPTPPKEAKVEEGANTAALRAERVAAANRIQEETSKRIAETRAREKAVREASMPKPAKVEHVPFTPRTTAATAKNRPVKKSGPGGKRRK